MNSSFDKICPSWNINFTTSFQVFCIGSNKILGCNIFDGDSSGGHSFSKHKHWNEIMSRNYKITVYISILSHQNAKNNAEKRKNSIVTCLEGLTWTRTKITTRTVAERKRKNQHTESETDSALGQAALESSRKFQSVGTLLGALGFLFHFLFGFDSRGGTSFGVWNSLSFGY